MSGWYSCAVCQEYCKILGLPYYPRIWLLGTAQRIRAIPDIFPTLLYFRMVSKSISQHSELKTSGLKWITQASVQSLGKPIIGECTRPVKHGTDSDTKLCIGIWCSLAKHNCLRSIKRLNDDEIHTWKLLDRRLDFRFYPAKVVHFPVWKVNFIRFQGAWRTEIVFRVHLGHISMHFDLQNSLRN